MDPSHQRLLRSGRGLGIRGRACGMGARHKLVKYKVREYKHTFPSS